jgi:hypothetical protein
MASIFSIVPAGASGKQLAPRPLAATRACREQRRSSSNST